VIAPTPTMWRGMASPTLSGKHSHRGARCASYSGHYLIVAHPFWREPRAPVLLLIDPCSYFLGAGLLVLKETKWNAQRLLRLLQYGLVLGAKGAAGATRSSAKCNKVLGLRIQALGGPLRGGRPICLSSSPILRRQWDGPRRWRQIGLWSGHI
jgi:hypothetical protein